MEMPLVGGTELAEALGVTPAAVSQAAREGRACAGRPVDKWVRRGEDGVARGYAVPALVRAALELRPFDEEGSEAASPQNGSSEEKHSEETRSEETPAEETLSEEALGHHARRYLEALATRAARKAAQEVADAAYEEMKPWLKDAVRARIEAGAWPPPILEEEILDKDGREEELALGDTAPGGAGGAGPGLSLSAPGLSAPRRSDASPSTEEPPQPGVDEEDSDGPEEPFSDESVPEESPPEREAASAESWRKRVLRRLIGRGRLEASGQRPGEEAPSSNDGSAGGRPAREKSPFQLLEALGEAYDRRAAEEGRIESTKDSPREALYRWLVAPGGPFGEPSGGSSGD